MCLRSCRTFAQTTQVSSRSAIKFYLSAPKDDLSNTNLCYTLLLVTTRTSQSPSPQEQQERFQHLEEFYCKKHWFLGHFLASLVFATLPQKVAGKLEAAKGLGMLPLFAEWLPPGTLLATPLLLVVVRGLVGTPSAAGGGGVMKTVGRCAIG